VTLLAGNLTVHVNPRAACGCPWVIPGQTDARHHVTPGGAPTFTLWDSAGLFGHRREEIVTEEVVTEVAVEGVIRWFAARYELPRP
jgi:hypothetical protein